MVVVYRGSNLDAINWKIYADHSNKSIRYFTNNVTSADLANQLCQFSLFDTNTDNDVNVINIEKWKLNDPVVIQNIKELHAIPNLVIFIYESATIKNKVFTDLDISKIKATAITKKSKAFIVHKMLSENNINLNYDTEEFLIDLLPEKIDFIQNEIKKLTLLEQKSFSVEEIRQIIIDLGDATVFNIIDSWLDNNQEQTIARLNDLLSKNVAISAFLPIFALKLTQIKFFLMAKQAQWSSEVIAERQSLPFWQQTNFNKLRPYDKNLNKINNMLDKLYLYDINVKKQKKLPYTQLVKILFE